MKYWEIIADNLITLNGPSAGFRLWILKGERSGLRSRIVGLSILRFLDAEGKVLNELKPTSER